MSTDSVSALSSVHCIELVPTTVRWTVVVAVADQMGKGGVVCNSQNKHMTQNSIYQSISVSFDPVVALVFVVKLLTPALNTSAATISAGMTRKSAW